MPFGAEQGVYEIREDQKGKQKICSPYLIKVPEFKKKECVDVERYKEYINKVIGK